MLGIMSGVSVSNTILKIASKNWSKWVLTSLVKRPITKWVVFKVANQIAKTLCVNGTKNITKETFCKGLAKAIPIISSVLSAAITAATFVPSCNKLKNKLSIYYNKQHKSLEAA